jgi:TonB family protein
VANSVGWTDEAIELSLDAMGQIEGMSELEGTGGPSVIAPALTDWRFRPAVDGGRPLPSRVLVAAMFRPPVLYNGPTLGSPPEMLAAPSSEVPVPTATTPPGYPPLGVADAVVLVEVLVGPDGRIQRSSVISGSPGFDALALTAARAWSFRAAQRNGRPVPAYAYLIFGFRRPTLP